MTYKAPEAHLADRELYDVVYSCLTTTTTFDAPDPTLCVIDYPCGLGKTSTLAEVLNRRPDIKVLVVVQTLTEVERIVSSAICLMRH